MVCLDNVPLLNEINLTNERRLKIVSTPIVMNSLIDVQRLVFQPYLGACQEQWVGKIWSILYHQLSLLLCY